MRIKFISLLIIVFCMGLFSSCEGPMGPEGPSGVGNWNVFEKRVQKSDWIKDSQNGVFYCIFEDGRIDPFAVTDGIITVELKDGGAYYPLPLTEYFYDGGYFAETINYSYGPGWIRFTIGANDLFDEAQPGYKPEAHLFKITVLW